MYGRVTKEDPSGAAAAGGEGASTDDNEIEFNPTGPVPRGYARCRPLEEILDEHAIHTVDFASIDVEGAEASALHCFPFRAYDIRTWLVETDKAGKDLYRIFMRAGYALVTEVLCPQNRLHSALTHMGVKLDSIFRRVSPGPFSPSSGPAWLPGGERAGKGPEPSCKHKAPCEEQVPHLEEEEVEESSLKLKLGTCRRGGMPMSVDPVAYRG
ncbi:unnamed protein product [Closterium sp. Yama58-4]|nr:unnamed protein product [Closterium sp. Yama58-4]